MLLYVDLISKVVVILLQFIQISDCFSFDNSYGDKTIDANHTGSAIIKFRYIPGINLLDLLNKLDEMSLGD